MTAYRLASLIKLLLGLVVVVIDALLISIKEDPAIALTLGMIGVFLFFWGLSYFLFYGAQWLVSTKISKERMQSDAYKSAFLFGLFALVNVLLLVAGFWTKWLSLALVVVFLGMQYIIFTDPKRKSHEGTST